MAQVILVDEQDTVIGTMEKMEAHQKGLLHRAFSIFIFNSNGEMLLHQRALDKYHSGGLWTNACCSHPQPGEEMIETARRRLKEEMGFETKLERIFDFIYNASFENGLTEFEFDHVFVGNYDGKVDYNREEVMDYSHKTMDEIRILLSKSPDKFSPWFCLAFPRVDEWWKKQRTHALT